MYVCMYVCMYDHIVVYHKLRVCYVCGGGGPNRCGRGQSPELACDTSPA